MTITLDGSDVGGHERSEADGVTADTGDRGDTFAYFDSGGFDGDAASDRTGSITHMDELASYEIAEGLFFRPVFAENISLNFVTFPPHSGFPEHVHPEEQISIVQEGEMEITVGALSRLVRPGDVVIYPPNVPHSGSTMDVGCRLIDVFSPPRTGIRDVIAEADPVRGADADRWWYEKR